MFTKSVVSKFSKKGLKDFKQLSGFVIIRLRDFLIRYKYEIEEMGYNYSLKVRNYNCPYEIICLVDIREDILSTLSSTRKKIYRKAGSRRRRRMKRQYYYSNVFNRIHGFVALENIETSDFMPEKINVVSLSIICSSSYSNKKGVGSALMNFTIEICKSKYSDIVLEVSNEFAENDNISDTESEYSDDEYSDDEESYKRNTNDEIIERITSEFERKTLRLRKSLDGKVSPYFNIGDEYIEDIIYSYLNDEKQELYDYTDKFISFNLDKPGGYDYGGFFYKKGKQSQIELFSFYEKFGFMEKPEINYEWKLFTPTPYPAMILSLK